MRLIALHEKTYTSENMMEATYTDAFSVEGASTVAASCNVDVTTPGVKTFDAPQFATLEIQDLTYTSVAAEEAANDISIAYVAPSSGTNALSVAVDGDAITVNLESTAAAAATAILNVTDDITFTSVATGAARNTTTFKTLVNAAAANPGATVLVAFTGTAAAIICTTTPNDGTNNGATPVELTTAELRELITTGAVVGKTVTITDASSLRALQTATGGGATPLAAGGEGDDVTATFADGANFNVAITTATQIKAAIEADSPGADDLVTVDITGTGSDVQVAAAADNLAGGTDGEINVDDSELTIPSHGLTTGLEGRLTTTGTLPTGYSLLTDYFVISIDANTIQLAASRADAIAGEPVEISDTGADGSINTFTASALAGATVKLQKTIDGTNWVDEGSATNISADAVIYLEKVDPSAKEMRVAYTITDGIMSAESSVLVKGPN